MWCQCWCQKFHVAAPLVLMTLHDQKKSCCTSFWCSWPDKWNGAIDDAFGITWYQCWCQCYHLTKSHVTLHFNHINLRNVRVTLIMPLASYDTGASTSDVTWPNKSPWTSFQLPWPNKCIYTGGDTIISMWCWCKYQWCHMTRKSHCNSFVLTQWMLWFHWQCHQ